MNVASSCVGAPQVERGGLRWLRLPRRGLRLRIAWRCAQKRGHSSCDRKIRLEAHDLGPCARKIRLEAHDLGLDPCYAAQECRSWDDRVDRRLRLLHLLVQVLEAVGEDPRVLRLRFGALDVSLVLIHLVFESLEAAKRFDLEEVRLGDWSHGEFRRRAATADPEFVAWSRTGRWDGIPGAEGDDVFRARVAAVINELAVRHCGESIAVVAHGGTIGCYLASVLGIHRSLWMTVENTSISVVRIADSIPTVVAVNDCHHLYDSVLGQ